MVRWLALFVVIAAWLPTPGLASAERALEQFEARDYQALTQSLGAEEAGYDPSRLYLLYKSYLKLDQKEQAFEVLKTMNERFTGPLRQVVLYERMDFYEANGRLEALLELGARFPRDIDNPYLERRLADHLGDLLDQRRPEDLRPRLEALFERFESFTSHDKLLQHYLAVLPEGDERRQWALEQLFKEGDHERLPRSIQKQFGFIKGAMLRYKETITQHFRTQYSERNFTYMRETIPIYLRYYQDGDREVFEELRKLYWRTYFRGRLYSRAIRQLNRPAELKPFDFSEAERLGMLLKFWLRKRHLGQVEQLLAQLEKGGHQEQLNYGYFHLGRHYFYEGAWVKAFEALRRVDASDFDEEDLIDLQWKLFLINHRVGHLVNLQRIADWAAQYDFTHDESAARFCYWGYKLGLYRKGTYMNCHQKYPRTFYGLKAKVVSQPYGAFSGSGPDLEFRFNRRALTDAERQYFDLLLVLYRVYENRAADSIVLSEERDLKDLTYFDALRQTLAQAERFYLLHRLVVRHYDELLGDRYYGNHYILPLLYPLAFEDQVEKNAADAKVSSLLVYAVMREESRYRPYVKSGAGAIGLLQLMPRTARYVGRRHRIRVQTRNLIDPDLNLKLGSTYLNMLSRRFDGNLYYTLAAYNGGATNVKRWIKRLSEEDMDYFVELITFSETKNYVKRVLKSYYLYQSIYGPR